MLYISNLFAQEEGQKGEMQPQRGSLGYGVGQDYGGFGAKFTVYPQKYVGVFGGVGWAMADLSYNAGIQIRYAKEIETSDYFGYLLAMYGYNAGVVVNFGSSLNKIYYGPSVGLGTSFKVGRTKRKSLNIALIYPFRSSEVQRYVSYLEDHQSVKFPYKLLPVTFSFGLSVPF